MKITLILTGKTELDYLLKGTEEYIKRIKRYFSFEVIYITDIKNAKNLTIEKYKQKEAENQVKYLQNADLIILLDEFGKEYSSAEFARYIESKMQLSIKNIVFVVGGAYGFTLEIKNMAHHIISLSKLTFPHQLVRLIFLEQLYRAFTIIRNEKYHHP
jgi:23S rRNA (pseudouridine1915-N3)-methyltransferase